MTITKEQLRKFKDLYYQNYGVLLSDDQALEIGKKLVGLIEIIYKKEEVRNFE